MRKIGEFQYIEHHCQPDGQKAQLSRSYQCIYENLCDLHLFILQTVNRHQNKSLAAKTTNNMDEEINYDPTDHKIAGGVIYSSFEY